MKNHINIIGGGAAGLFAAAIAAEKGAAVTIFERKKIPGLKLKITGKGRCNLTNMVPLPEFLEHFNKHGRFLRHAFNLFFNQDLITFFENIGIPVKTERGGRVFPQQHDAKALTDLLISHVKQLGVQIKIQSRVNSFVIQENEIIGIKYEGDKKLYKADAHILATGGKSYPLTGSSGDGYELVRSLGHRITPLIPSLVPLETKEGIPAELAGFLLKNVRIQAYIDGKSTKPAFGELQFTENGLSGATILTYSRQIVPALNEGKAVDIEIDLKPALDHKVLDKRLLREFSELPNKQLVTILKNILPKSLIAFCLEQTEIPPEKKGRDVSASERKILRLWLKSVKFKISKPGSWAEAIITAGGISTKEIDPKTMASRIVKNLYFAGEVMDIDADTGGFNLQAAFSTAYLAAESACCASK